MARSKGVVIPISAEDNSARAFDSVNAQVARLREQVAALRAQGGGAGEAVAGGFHSATSQVQATSAAIRTLEGNPGIRAIERFLITIPGVGAALQAAFPVIGALALTAAVVEGIEKLVEYRKKAAQFGMVINRAYAEWHNASLKAIDDLSLTNDKLENANAKLAHKPTNNLAIAIDETRVKADELAKSLAADLEKSDALLQKAHVSRLKGMFGQESTNDVEGTVQYYRGKMSDAGYALQDATRAGDKDGEAKATKDLNDAKRAYAQWIKEQISARTGTVQRTVDNEDVRYSGPRPTETVGYDVVHGKQDANLGILRGERSGITDAADLQAQQQRNAADVTAHSDLEGRALAEATARRIEEAQQRLTDAQRKMAEQSAQAQADAAKNAADLALSTLDDQHRRQLVSDSDYYEQKLAIQTGVLNQEEASNRSKQGDLASEVAGLSAKQLRDKGADKINDAAKIVELQMQVNELEDKRATIVEKRKKLEQEAGTEAFELAKKAGDEELKLAAEIEAIRGGSTAARQSQAAVARGNQRRNLVVNGASPQEIDDFDAATTVGSGQLDLKSAEDASRNADTDSSTKRSTVQHQQATGAIGELQARQALIALDQQEAAALQPVLAAWQKLADDGVDGAKEKVAQLNEKIAELKTPVNEVAMEVRNQFDSAFEQLFVNMDKGKKALEQFKKSLQADLMKDTYKNLIQPGLDAGISKLIPQASGTSSPTPTSAAGGWFGSLLHLFAKPTKPDGAAGPITVNIINQTSSPAQGSATSPGGGSLTDAIRPSVIQIMLEDMSSAGPVSQGMSGVVNQV